MPSTAGSAAVWLIHGTWARRAKWTEGSSSLHSAIRSGWDVPVEVAAFEWTGRNSTRERGRAVRELTAAVSDAGDARPRFAIAHSHGGNIALQAALAKPSLFDGVVTLNTPFLTAQPHNNFVVVLNLILVQFALFGIACNGLQRILDRALSLGEYLLLITILGPILVAVGVGLLVGFRRRESGVVTGFGANLLRYPGGARPRVLCINYADDEAVGWLGALDALSSLPGLLLHRIALPLALVLLAVLHYVFAWDLAGPSVLFNISRILSEYGAIFPGAADAFLARLEARDLAVTPNDVAELSAFFWNFGSRGLFAIVFPLSVLSYFLIFWALVGLTAFLVAYVGRAVAFGEGFGIAAVASAFITKLTVTPTPMVPCRLDVIVVNEERSRWLRHSDIYENPVVIDEIVRWMRTGSEAGVPVP